MMNEPTSVVQIAVKALVQHVFLSGSIDTGFSTVSPLIEGTRAHQKLQQQYGEQDEKEVYVSCEIPYGDLVYKIDGRCDGVLVQEEGLTIDEIKSTSLDLELLTKESYPVYWAQARCYAYILAKERELERIRVQLTYIHTISEETRVFQEERTLRELEAFVYGVVEQYVPFAEMLVQHRKERDDSIQALSFPFERYRPGQRKLAGAVYRTIDEGVRLFAKAPTGIGKTISTLFPAVKAMGQGMLKRIYYLTAKTITRTTAEEAFLRMEGQGLKLHSVTLTAKEKVCFQDKMSCRKDDCPYANGYYDRLNEGLLDLLTHETRITRPVIEGYARKHTLCPFEFGLDASYAADAVICDYNYIFDPRISLKRLMGEVRSQTALLVDEAHNLVDRAREMYSSTLVKSEALEIQRAFKGVDDGVAQAAKAINQYFIDLRKSTEEKEWVQQEAPEDLLALAEAFSLQSERYLMSASTSHEGDERLLDVYYQIQNFIRTGKLYGEQHVTYVEQSRSEVRLKLFCLDPSDILRQMGKGFRSHIYFSATLSPLSYYRDMLGANEEDYSLSVPTPFYQEQLDVIVQPLSTRYHDRERTQGTLVRLLTQLVENRQGNYLFFFPSYAYMQMIQEAFLSEEQTSQYDILIQESVMDEEAREQFLARFDADNNRTLIGFAVLGGIFSEGIDLVGDRLTGVVVVGVGLPQLSFERNIIRDYFNQTGRNGFDYAYIYPGMNKVLQAGGRLIRSEEDEGVLVLVDDRYLSPQYQRLLPEEWAHYRVPSNHDSML